MNTPGNRVGHDAVVTEELKGIVIRASQLGYSPWRVGIALRVPPVELAWICAHVNETDTSGATTLSATRQRTSW